MMPNKQILIVEDNEINRAMLREILSSTYQVLEAENGQEALLLLKAHRDDISLILLDIIMPVMDGYTFLALMREDPACALIPVIVTTQQDSETDEVTALAKGATDFVAKPYKPQIILHRVASIIKLRETAAMINQFQYDQLTGLYSKEFFYQRVRERLCQNPEGEYDIICSDIENFKLVNDSFGMPEGDRLLCDVAELMRAWVGKKGICGRLNADQFACLLEHKEYTDQVFLDINAQINSRSTTKNIVMKWGVYVITSRKPTVEQMCDRALLAARSVKGQYRKYFVKYDDKLRSKLLRDQVITDSMEQALVSGQFVVYLQPKYSLKDDRLAGAEALVRWEHPEWGFLAPAEFIPIFEKNGFITRLDQFVWDKVCATMHGWAQKGYPMLPVSVNMSRADAYQSDLADVLMGMLEKYDLPPCALHLEITESAYTENPDQIISTVEQLRTLGFIIEMDDFGSGYSSLNMLNQMGLDVLKLDMKFIQSETAKPKEQGILRFIMSLARGMNLSVVAEGVETQEQLERLRELDCDYVQGYFFARPMSCQEFERLLSKLAEQPEPRAVEQPVRQQPAQALFVADEDEACRDYLTGLLNRRGLLAAAKALGKNDLPLAVYLFDLDNLKGINDTLGRTRGDQALEGFAEVLKRCTRATDLLSRFGGDEFLVVARGMGTQQDALNKGEKICRAFARYGQAGQFPGVCCAGVSMCEDGQTHINELIAQADQALFRAKNSNKGGCCVWRG